MKKRNGMISLWKFMFSLLILVHHFFWVKDGNAEHSLFICGAIGVDFFFLVSGYLLAKKVASENLRGDTTPLYKSTWKFLIGKVKVFYPYLLISFAVCLAIQLSAGRWGKMGYLDSVSDLFLIQAITPKSQRMVGGTWYLSAMMFAMMIVYPTLKKLGKNFSCIIAPCLVAIAGGTLIYTQSSLRAWSAWTGIMCMGLAKAILEVSLGCFVYECSKYLSKIRFTRFARILLGALQTGLFAFVFLVNAIYTQVRPLDWMFIIMLAIGVAIAFSDQIPWQEWSNNKVFAYLERLSTPIYLGNFIGIGIVNNVAWFQRFPWLERCIIMAGIVIVFAIIELWVVEYLRKRDYSKLKRLFIKQEKT